MGSVSNVILVESDEFIRKKVEKKLAESGYNVIGVSNTKEAVKKAEDMPFEIVITEIETPELSKYIEVIRKFKRINSDSSIIVAATYDSIVGAVAALKEGAYDYVIKPFNFEELSLVIDKAVEWRNLQVSSRERLSNDEEKIFFDPQTAVYNNRYFQESVKIEINRVLRYPSYVSFLFIDIDNFQEYRNKNGAEVSNKALKEIAQLFWRYTRNCDYVARYIDTQFVVIMPETKKEGGFVLASRLSTVIREITFPDKDSTTGGKFTVSIGVVTCPDDAETKDELIQKAELALNQAKKLGKDRIVLF